MTDVLERAAAGGRITEEEALELYRHAPLHALGQVKGSDLEVVDATPAALRAAR